MRFCFSRALNRYDKSIEFIFPGKSTGVGCHFLLQRIFPTQESNQGLPHCRQTLYRLSHKGSPYRIHSKNQKDPPSMGFSRQEYCSGLQFPSPGDLPDTGIGPRSPTLQTFHQGILNMYDIFIYVIHIINMYDKSIEFILRAEKDLTITEMWYN